MAENVGLICGAITGNIYAIINPDDDSELDNPRWLLIQVGVQSADGEPPPEREPVMMVRMPMAGYMACNSHDQVQSFATTAYQTATRVA